MPSRACCESTSTSSSTAAPLPSYIVNDKGFLTVRPTALQDTHPDLASRAADATGLLLAAYAPDRLLLATGTGGGGIGGGGGGGVSAAGGATYALSMMVHNTNVLWWHLGPYDECR